MANNTIHCQVCGRQIVSKSTEDTTYTIGADYGDRRCLRLFYGFVCPKCTPSEIEFGRLMEREMDYE